VRISDHPADHPPAPPGEGALDITSTTGGNLYLELPMSAAAPRIARASLTAWAEDQPVGPGRLDRLRLIASEVVTNAVRHSGAGADATVRVAASRIGREMLVTVTDAGEDRLPRMREPDGSTGGYGMHIVSAEARRWGVERAEGTRVWFTV